MLTMLLISSGCVLAFLAGYYAYFLFGGKVERLEQKLKVEHEEWCKMKEHSFRVKDFIQSVQTYEHLGTAGNLATNFRKLYNNVDGFEKEWAIIQCMLEIRKEHRRYNESPLPASATLSLITQSQTVLQ